MNEESNEYKTIETEPEPEHPDQVASITNVNIGGFRADRRANGLRYSYLLHRELMRYCRQNGESVCAVIEPLVYGFLVGSGHQFTYDLGDVHKYYTRVVRDAPMEVNIYRNLHHDRRAVNPVVVNENPDVQRVIDGFLDRRILERREITRELMQLGLSGKSLRLELERIISKLRIEGIIVK